MRVKIEGTSFSEVDIATHKDMQKWGLLFTQKLLSGFMQMRCIGYSKSYFISGRAIIK